MPAILSWPCLITDTVRSTFLCHPTSSHFIEAGQNACCLLRHELTVGIRSAATKTRIRTCPGSTDLRPRCSSRSWVAARIFASAAQRAIARHRAAKYSRACCTPARGAAFVAIRGAVRFTRCHASFFWFRLAWNFLRGDTRQPYFIMYTSEVFGRYYLFARSTKYRYCWSHFNKTHQL